LVNPEELLDPASPYTRPSIKTRPKEEALLLASLANLEKSLFTDASKQGQSPVGCAVVYFENQEWKLANRCALHPDDSVFRGELIAIILALEEIKIKWKNSQETITIYSDSKSALQALRNIYTRDPDMNRAQKLLRSLREKGLQVNLEWVPGHENIPGNEFADQEAKYATELETPQKLWHKHSIKKAMNESNKFDWQTRWDFAYTGRFTHMNVPKVKEDISFEGIPELSRIDKVNLRQALSGHFPCKQYLHRFKRSDSPSCRFCAAENESIAHLLLTCPRFGEKRNQMLRSLPENTTVTTIECFRPPLLSFAASILYDTIKSL
jgi:ribonuclease HI